LNLGNKTIDKNSPIFIIAEAGVNYNNKLPLAFKMVDAAINAGADAIKFQTFVASNIQMKNSIKPQYQKKLDETSYYKIIKSLEPSFDDQIKIFQYCKKRKILFLSTPYDQESVDFLDQLGVPAFKIASTDLTNHILLKHIAKKRKPILLSTGLSEINQVTKSVKLLIEMKMKNKLILFHTTSDYPTNHNDVNLLVIPEYSKKFKIPVGFSDHTQDYVASLGAVTLGAKVLEKHFTLDRSLPGPDQSSSLEPSELSKWIQKIRILEKSLGTNKKIITKSEKNNLSMRKMLIIKPIKKNSTISQNHLLALRGDGKGILPLEENIKKIVGKKILKNIDKSTQFSWKMLSK
jgi:N,N'-diacetyllegionaminate synthase